jgi:phosphate transport system permease protein
VSDRTKTGSLADRSAARAAASLLARGEPMVWLTGAGLVVGLLMVVSLVGYVFYQGLVTFWPKPVVEITTLDGQVSLGEVTRSDSYRPGRIRAGRARPSRRRAPPGWSWPGS